MNKQAGRYTVAYVSKRFPFFTINKKARDGVSRYNKRQLAAFMARVLFVESIKDSILHLGLTVDGSCNFVLIEESDFSVVRSLIRDAEVICADGGSDEAY